ncbi:hypothetical protein DY000_02014942 [Brassica cretica]|uniref:Uncharacterized protein n=1 Tax=Brassica cretica TaxID=69181 RepID=A0ABQ7DCL0_BRACR|nr:hypothetical protein DY000_02014942 [Brassica cretica]
MATTLVLIQDANGDLHKYEGHLRNAPGQRLDNQGDVIPDPEAIVLEDGNAENAAANAQAAVADC